jgi:hypothetical protein
MKAMSIIGLVLFSVACLNLRIHYTINYYFGYRSADKLQFLILLYAIAYSIVAIIYSSRKSGLKSRDMFELSGLAALKERGAITPEEFEKEKKRNYLPGINAEMPKRPGMKTLKTMSFIYLVLYGLFILLAFGGSRFYDVRDYFLYALAFYPLALAIVGTVYSFKQGNKNGYDSIQQLSQLAALKDKGIISAEEFEAGKIKILG